MSRVVTHAVKQASLNLRDMVDKKQIGLEISDLEDLTEYEDIHFWAKDTKKPEVIGTLIDQIKSIFDVGNEVTGWSAQYFPPPVYSTSERKYSSPDVSISPVEKGLGCRFVIVVGSREVANLSVSTGSVNAETPALMMSGDCLYLKVTVCPVLTITFSNVNSEKMAPRKGFRETVVKKTPQQRHVLVIDGHVAVGDVVKKVQKDLLPTFGEKKTGMLSDLVAKMASSDDKKSENKAEEIPELVPMQK